MNMFMIVMGAGLVALNMAAGIPPMLGTCFGLYGVLFALVTWPVMGAMAFAVSQIPKPWAQP